MADTSINYISTKALAKKFNISSKELFIQLVQIGFIEKKGEVWSLTNTGVDAGGKFKTSKQYGKYITWPENLVLDISGEKLITSTEIGKEFQLSANKTDFLLSEIGWIYNGIKGWIITPQGIRQNGVQDENKTSGVPYVRWHQSIKDSKILHSSIKQVKGTSSPENQENNTLNTDVGFREKFEAKHQDIEYWGYDNDAKYAKRKRTKQ